MNQSSIDGTLSFYKPRAKNTYYKPKAKLVNDLESYRVVNYFDGPKPFSLKYELYISDGKLFKKLQTYYTKRGDNVVFTWTERAVFRPLTEQENPNKFKYYLVSDEKGKRHTVGINSLDKLAYQDPKIVEPTLEEVLAQPD